MESASGLGSLALGSVAGIRVCSTIDLGLSDMATWCSSCWEGVARSDVRPWVDLTPSPRSGLSFKSHAFLWGAKCSRTDAALGLFYVACRRERDPPSNESPPRARDPCYSTSVHLSIPGTLGHLSIPSIPSPSILIVCLSPCRVLWSISIFSHALDRPDGGL